ncbi:MAG: carbohydrate kinase family protein [Tenericutes bacterium]|nr:carbohydrate kinase family protein [Mycoplasmatota bacterium]
MKVLVIGGASYDEIIHLDKFPEPAPKTIFARESYQTPGSTGLGKALAFKKLGYDVDFIAVIAKDTYGKNIEKALAKEKVNFFPIYKDQTERHTNILNKLGQRISIFTAVPTYDEIKAVDYERLIKGADIVVLNIKSYCKAFISLIKTHEKPVYCDLHDYDGTDEYYKEFIENSEYIFMSSERIHNFQVFMKDLKKKGKKWIVCTHGQKGSTALTSDKFDTIPATKLEVVDTNGAGDNFFVGFVHGYLNDFNTEDSLLLGRILADSCIESKEIVNTELSLEYLNKKFLETM